MDFKNTIRKIVSVFASSEFAFIYCIIGTLAQTSHTYYLVDSISSLEGFSKALQAFALSFFISSSLLFFTAIADDKDDSKESKRVLLAVNLFMVIEIIINVYYYGSHLLLKTDTPQTFDFIFAILVSCLIPVTIKLYAGVIKAKQWIEAEAPNMTQSNNTPVEKPVEAPSNTPNNEVKSDIEEKSSDDKVGDKIASLTYVNPTFNKPTDNKPTFNKPTIIQL